MSGFGLAGPPPAPSIPGWTHLRTGKVRDLYTNDLGNILLVASDRISAYDWVMPTEIPGKGRDQQKAIASLGDSSRKGKQSFKGR